jgi:adenosylhomocysteine nucleosidase
MNERIVGIMGAMSEEIHGVINLLTEKQEFSFGMRTYYTGKINGIKAVVVFSRWGKVAAATTVSTLILKFNVTEIIFTGVAGAISNDLRIGDIVLGKRLIQHDLNGSPMVEEFEVPLLGVKFLEAQEEQLTIATNAVNNLLENKHLYKVVSETELEQFNITAPKLFIGDIASGDKFFAKQSEKENLLKRIPTVLCVEMEGAAVAQVCYEFDIPFTILRTISDTADEQSHIDFPAFIEKISNNYSIEIIKNIFKK